MIGKLAAIEVPDNSWPELIPSLDAGIKNKAALGLRQASLEALGFVCEEVPDGLEAHSMTILTAIASGMDATETNDEVKLAATSCLVNAMEFIKSNMDQENDRNTIMKMVFSVTSSPVEAVRIQAFSCIAQIASSYYKYLGPFMGVIFTQTTAAIQGQSRDVALQAIEFWSTVADVELECLDEDESEAGNKDYKSRSLNIITQAVQPLAPVLLAALTQQNEDPEDDEWGVALAAGTCLGLCSQVAGNALVPHVLPFITTNVANENWRFREAAILTFGCILDGPKKEDLTPLVKQAFMVILARMNDPVPLVKDTTAWTIGRICSLLPEVIDEASLATLMNVLIDGLGPNQPAKVASNVCWAIHNLASSVEPDESAPDTSVLSPYFQRVVQALLVASRRPDVKDCNLQVSVYEALNIMIQSAAPDTFQLVAQVMPLIMASLNDTIRGGAAANAEAQNEIQALLCGSLQAIVTKLPVEHIQPQADALMTLFLQVLSSKNLTVHEEALMAIGAVADKVEAQFAKYMSAIKAPLIAGLTNAQEWKVCDVAVNVTCDVTRAVGQLFQPWGDEVMKILLGHLSNASVERTVKAHIIACIGDIALAIGGHFDRYLSFVIPMLIQASATTCAPDDWDNIDYTESLRESIIEAYSGILFGLAADNKVNLFVSQQNLIPSILKLFELIASDEHAAERIIRGAAGLTLDLVNSVGPQIVPTLRVASVDTILKMAVHEDRDPGTQLAGKEARKVRDT